ncbi:metallophosphoesterase [Sphaerimonospora thailandensis]|uniref:HTH cro/C1-type domain-containing protein n=1 Tax=Sphaerimonospora thailandensis TaxID=795644 RepID=A0A8J3RAQ0_9ACTN|nr:metallophosphoesterase [Sphaerimonospora thailandensis]GIH71189.1 hypothetical protein Mth01_34420 [Sphaerimonospora thailandensis]
MAAAQIYQRPFGELLRHWREHRRLSQLELSIQAEISTRHLSFLETGRARPSRDMVLHITEHLEIPLRERNHLLLAAGYAPAYTESPLDSPQMAAVCEAIRRLLSAHEPYPAVVVDRGWNLVDANAAIGLIAEGVDPDLLTNVLRASGSPGGARPPHRQPRRVARSPARPASGDASSRTSEPDRVAVGAGRARRCRAGRRILRYRHRRSWRWVMVVLAQVSDIHIDGSGRNTSRAVRALDYARSMRPDAILLTGDIADHGAVEEYEIVRDLISFDDVPLVLCPGNHDVRGNLRKVLLGRDGDQPVNQALNLETVTIALCDSSIPGRDDGHLDDDTLAWLDSVLAARPGVRALVGMHHPAVELGIPYVDAIRLNRPEQLRQVLDRHPHVLAVLAGHAHTAAATTFAGRPLLVAPGVVSTILLPAETPVQPPIDFTLPPAIAIHLLYEDRIATHYRPIP